MSALTIQMNRNKRCDSMSYDTLHHHGEAQLHPGLRIPCRWFCKAVGWKCTKALLSSEQYTCCVVTLTHGSLVGLMLLQGW